MELSSHLDCTGCGLCAHVCPRKCISWEMKELGHYYPIIDNSRCVDCGLCQKACPVINVTNRNTADSAFAGWAKNAEEYRTSTSGAAASIISRLILKCGGVVYGCAALPGLNVRHIRVDQEKDLLLLKGSKYVSSDISDVFLPLKEDVSLGKVVLFIGMPCQVAAVMKFIQPCPTNLFLIDLVCHGAPSQGFLKEYFKRDLRITLNCISTLSFRKDNEVRIEAFDTNGNILFRSKEYRTEHWKDPYYGCFMKGYSFRESCYRCNYSCSARVSDMTIGDFWGLGKMSPCDLPSHDYGVSLLMPNNDKGNQLLEMAREKMYLFERPIEEAIQGNEHLRFPQTKNHAVRLFRKLYPILGITYSFIFVDSIRRLFRRLFPI